MFVHECMCKPCVYISMSVQSPYYKWKKKPTLPPEKNFKKKKIPQIIFILSFCLANNGVFNNDNNNTIKEIIITIRKNEKE